MKYFLLFLILIIGCETVPPIKYPAGGYDYPKNVAAKDTSFYYYPLKDIESRRDYFYDALRDEYFKLFNEPNISLKPADKEIFRFVYSGSKIMPVVILLTDQKIILKQGINMGSGGPMHDETRLTPIERLHYNFFWKFIPYNTINLRPWEKTYHDSMIKRYPQLLDTKYLHDLSSKTIVPKGKTNFTLKTISLTKNEFAVLVNDINASGYWKSPRLIKCESPDADGYGFSLEANTKEKYNLVFVEGCSDDTTKFTKACQKLIEYAQLGESYNLIWSGETIKVDSTKLLKP